MMNSSISRTVAKIRPSVSVGGSASSRRWCATGSPVEHAIKVVRKLGEDSTIHNVMVRRLNERGDGEVCFYNRTDEREVTWGFPKMLPGDVINVDVAKVKVKNFWMMSKRDPKNRKYTFEVSDLVENSPDAVEPPCPHFAKNCGGCQLQNLRYSRQLYEKRNALVDTLKEKLREDEGEFGRGNILFDDLNSRGEQVIGDVLPSPPLRFRGKAEFLCFRRDGLSGPVVLGFRERGSPSDRVPVTACKLLLSPDADVALKTVQMALDDGLISNFDERTGRGDLSYLIIRCAVPPSEKKIMSEEDRNLQTQVLVQLVGPAIRIDRAQELTKRLRESVGGLAGVIITRARHAYDPEMGMNQENVVPETLYGKPYLIHGVRGKGLKITTAGFFQPTIANTELLANTVYSMAKSELERVEMYGRSVFSNCVWDLFSGSGFFSLFLSELAHVVSVDCNTQELDLLGEQANSRDFKNSSNGSITRVKVNLASRRQLRALANLTHPRGTDYFRTTANGIVEFIDGNEPEEEGDSDAEDEVADSMLLDVHDVSGADSKKKITTSEADLEIAEWDRDSDDDEADVSAAQRMLETRMAENSAKHLRHQNPFEDNRLDGVHCILPPSVVVIDPPGAGLHKAAKRWIRDRLRPPVVIYVSTNYATQARDIRMWLLPINQGGAGYRLEKVIPMDFHPHTMHLKTIMLLRRQ